MLDGERRRSGESAGTYDRVWYRAASVKFIEGEGRVKQGKPYHARACISIRGYVHKPL